MSGGPARNGHEDQESLNDAFGTVFDLADQIARRISPEEVEDGLRRIVRGAAQPEGLAREEAAVPEKEPATRPLTPEGSRKLGIGRSRSDRHRHAVRLRIKSSAGTAVLGSRAALPAYFVGTGGLAARLAENADLVLALVVGLAFAVLGPLGVVSETAINNVILGTLAVFNIMVLRGRASSKSLIPKARGWLREISNNSAKAQVPQDFVAVRTLRGAEAPAAQAEAREQTDHWYFKGGTGTYLRAVTLPKCLEDPRRTMQFRIEIIDPGNHDACRRYDDFRRSRLKGPGDTSEFWQAGQTRLESYATILAACWYNQHRQFLSIKVGLTSTVSTLRYDMSSTHLIITQDDPELPALVILRGTGMFDAYDRELLTSFEQAVPVQFDLAQKKVHLSDDPTPGEVHVLLHALGLPTEQPLSNDEAQIIVEKAFHAPNPYAAIHKL